MGTHSGVVAEIAVAISNDWVCHCSLETALSELCKLEPRVFPVPEQAISVHTQNIRFVDSSVGAVEEEKSQSVQEGVLTRKTVYTHPLMSCMAASARRR
jgi:hypothetical protein